MIQQEAVRGRESLELDVQLHNEVYEAINRGDGQLAADTMLTVVLEGKNSLIAALRSDAKSTEPNQR
jgi:DNA-binding FadR family transcriptional regulator